MSLLESLNPTLTEISSRHQSLMVFIQKAQKQLPVLRYKLETAQPKDVTKIREAVYLISKHIDKNVQEAADLQDVAGSLLIQCEDDRTGTAATAIAQLKQMIQRGQTVQDGLADLYGLIAGIIAVLDSKTGVAQVSPIVKDVAAPAAHAQDAYNAFRKQEIVEAQQPRVEQSVTIQNPPPPPPIPKTPSQPSKAATISTPHYLQQTIDQLKVQLAETKQQLLDEMEFNRKQTELIGEIQEDVNYAQQKHSDDIRRLQEENSLLKQYVVRMESSAKCYECPQLRSQLQQAKDDLELLRVDYEKLSYDNQRLSEQSEIEIKDLQCQLLELQDLAQKEAIKQHSKQREAVPAENVGMQVARSPNRVRHYDSVQAQLQTQFKALQDRYRGQDDELSDPDDARVVCDRNQVSYRAQRQPAEFDEVDVRTMLREKEEMRQMIESLKSVLVKMTKSVSPQPQTDRSYRGSWQ